MKFWLLTWPWNQVQKLAVLEYFEEEEKKKKKKKGRRRRRRYNKQWPPKSAQLLCHLCSSHGKRKGTVHQV